jgi:hypothetical protein
MEFRTRDKRPKLIKKKMMRKILGTKEHEAIREWRECIVSRLPIHWPVFAEYYLDEQLKCIFFLNSFISNQNYSDSIS